MENVNEKAEKIDAVQLSDENLEKAQGGYGVVCYPCMHCGKIFKIITELYDHMKKEHS